MNRPVTERDFRAPEFADAKVEDYEWRADGKLVRKDRWETGIRKIASILGLLKNREFEIPDVVKAVAELELSVNPQYQCQDPECGVEPRLAQCLRTAVTSAKDSPSDAGLACPECQGPVLPKGKKPSP